MVATGAEVPSFTREQRRDSRAECCSPDEPGMRENDRSLAAGSLQHRKGGTHCPVRKVSSRCSVGALGLLAVSSATGASELKPAPRVGVSGTVWSRRSQPWRRHAPVHPSGQHCKKGGTSTCTSASRRTPRALARREGLPGPQGAQGAQGIAGIAGAKGETGATGKGRVPLGHPEPPERRG